MRDQLYALWRFKWAILFPTFVAYYISKDVARTKRYKKAVAEQAAKELSLQN